MAKPTIEHRRWSVLLVAFLCNNIAMAVTFAAFGVVAMQITQTFGSRQSVTSLGIGLVSLMMGLGSPVVGILLDRWSMRGTITIGCLVAALGFYCASRANSAAAFIISFGVVTGLGITAMGVLPAVKLASTWFPQAPGKALGVVTLSVSMAVGPPVFGYIVDLDGWRGLMKALALVVLMLLPMVWLLIPARQPGTLAAGSSVPKHRATDTLRHATAGTLRGPGFWWLVLAAGILLSSGILIYAHVASHALNIGYTVKQAALLISVAGLSAVAGSLGFGWAADRYSPALSVIANALCQGTMWLVLALTASLYLSLGAIALGGFAAGGAYAAITALITQRYGQQNVGTMAGQLALLVIPFNFGMPPLIGWLFDETGSYHLAFLFESAACLVAILSIKLLSGGTASGPQPGDRSSTANGP